MLKLLSLHVPLLYGEVQFNDLWLGYWNLAKGFHRVLGGSTADRFFTSLWCLRRVLLLSQESLSFSHTL